MRGVVGCIGRGRVAIGSCYREREREGWGEGGERGGREEEGREEGRERIKATGVELTQAKKPKHLRG